MPAISTDYLTNRKRRLRALIVGINDYSGAQLLSGATPVVQSLRGAIPDAEAMHDYLRGHYPSDIRTLYDSQATRENIIEGIKALANGDFNKGDPIVIFFAGHGARAFSPKDGGWPRSTDGFIEGIVPYDYGREETSFIPDRTLAALLDDLAKTAAGEDRDADPNITIIFDCCHSGSAARTSEVDGTILERGFDIASPVPSDLDKDIWDPIEKERPRVFKPTPGFKHAGARSHVLLAACAEHELARETAGRGVFTTALLKILERPDARELTYKEIMNSLPAMLQQTPQVVGVNSNRLLFSGTRSSRHGYLIRRDDGERFKLKAGAMHGVGLKTQFSVWRAQSDREPVGTFTINKVQPDHCLGTIDFSSETPADADAFSALIVNREAKETLKLFISGLDDDLAFAVRDAIQNITETAGTGLFEVYEHEVGAHMKISGKEGKLTFEYAEELFKSFHELSCPRIDPFDVDLVRNALDGAQRFLWHLNRSPGDAMGSKGIFQVCEVKVQMFELEDTGRYTVSPKFEVPVLGRKAYIELEKGEDSPPYGMAITNNSPIDLYASVFYFDCNDLSIQCYSSTPNQGASVQPHLRAGKTLTIGYDSPDQGGIPFSYYLSGKNDVEVGFIKIFLSNVASDLSVIEQYSPFSPDYRGAKPYVAKTISVWDEMTIAVEQRLKETV